MFKINNRSTENRSGVFIVNIEYIWRYSKAFFADFEWNTGWNTLVP